MKSFSSIFSGFGGADLGAKNAGLQLAWGIEKVAPIAEVGNFNLGQHIKVADLLDCNPANFEHVDVLHASPPCPNFSISKTNGRETALDIALAKKVSEFVTSLMPDIFTLENVLLYRYSKSWRWIENALYGAGYWLHIDHIDAADYGVPQNRKRFFVRAIHGGFVPYLPQPETWNSWYDAIKDLIPSLKKSEFAPWQSAFVDTAKHERIFMVTGQNSRNSVGWRRGDQPAFTVTACQKADTRFCVDGITRSMDTRCFARLQTFPDSYALSGKNQLDARGIGNAVAPLMYQKIIRGLTNL